MSATELISSIIERIEQVEPVTAAFCHLDLDGLRVGAREVDDDLAHDRYRGPLHGIPVAVKDLIAVAGMPLRAGSEALPDRPCATDAWSVARLREAGALMAGKTRTDEFAFGITTAGTHNPHDPARIPGGSSGGSAAAVASGAAPLALGTDTGGSVRTPAALCGIVGLKPTFGRVGRTGVVPLSWSLDHVGVFGRCVADVAMALACLSGFDSDDVSSVARKPPRIDLGDGVLGMQVGVVPQEGWVQPIDPRAWSSFESVVEDLADSGVHTSTVRLPMMLEAPSVLMAILLPEFADAQHESFRRHPERYGDAVREGLVAGALLPASGYVRANRFRLLLKQAWRSAFEGLDAVVMPAVPRGATVIDHDPIVWQDGLVESVDAAFSRYACGASLAGTPVLTVPCGRDTDGMPVGFQIVGRPFAEHDVLRLGAAVMPRPVPPVP